MTIHDNLVCTDDDKSVTPASGSLYDILDMELLEKEYDRQRLTYHELHRRTGENVSESTIYRFFARQAKNPSAYNVLTILLSMGVSVDRILHLQPTEPPSDPNSIHHLETEIEVLRSRIESKDKHISDLERQKSDAEILRDRYKEHFMAEIEKERTRHAAELDQERKRCDSELIRRDQQHEEEKKIIRRRGTVRFVLAMSLAALSTLLFGLYLGADMLLSGDYALLRQLFQ